VRKKGGGGLISPDNLANVGRNQVADELLGVVKDRAALLNSRNNGGKVVVSENHVRGLLGNSGSRSHGNTNISLFQGGGIVDTITSLGEEQG